MSVDLIYRLVSLPCPVLRYKDPVGGDADGTAEPVVMVGPLDPTMKLDPCRLPDAEMLPLDVEILPLEVDMAPVADKLPVIDVGPRRFSVVPFVDPKLMTVVLPDTPPVPRFRVFVLPDDVAP